MPPREQGDRSSWRLVERLFGTEIRPYERQLVALLTLDLFVLLTTYYMLKVIREPLVLMEGGVVSRNAARGTQAAILLFLIPAYSTLADRINPRRLVGWVFAFFAATLMAFPLLKRVGLPLGLIFFVWLGIFSITVVAQFWSLSNDLFSVSDGKRLFPVIAAGGTLGAIAGAQLVAQANRWLDPTQIVLLAVLLLSLCIFITRRVCTLGETFHSVPQERQDEDPRGGFQLFFGSRYLLLIGLSILLLNFVNTTGDQVMALIIERRAEQLPDPSERVRLLTTFYARFQTWVSVLTSTLQVFVVGRLLRVLGARLAVLILPLLAVGGYGTLAIAPLIGLTRAFKIVENSADYSVQSTVQQVLFLPTSRQEKYKAKAAIDTFLVRIGDLGSWALVAFSLHVGSGVRGLSMVNLCVSVAWVFVAFLVGWRYRQLIGDDPNGVHLAQTPRKAVWSSGGA